MNVLHVIQRFPPAIGGAEAWCEGVVRHLAGRGHSVEVLALDVLDEDELWQSVPRPPGAVAVGPLDIHPGIRVRRCRPSPTPYGLLRVAETAGMRLAGRFSAELFGRTLGAARRADVVHLHHCNVVSSFWGLAAARLARRPVVVTPHSHPGDPLFEQGASRWLLRRADVVIAVTPHEVGLLVERGVAAERIVTASNAVDADRFDIARRTRARARAFLGLGSETALLTFIGRKSEDKDIPVLVAAASRLARTAGVALVLAGPTSDWYESARTRWDAGGLHLIDLAAIPEESKPPLLAATDVLVQPSRREAFGIVFLEAWASGIPVVGAASGAVPEVVGDAGLTFTPGDAADLATKVAWLLAHPDEARAMAARGRERVVRQHTWERVGVAVEHAYATALRARRPAAVPAARASGDPAPSASR